MDTFFLTLLTSLLVVSCPIAWWCWTQRKKRLERERLEYRALQIDRAVEFLSRKIPDEEITEEERLELAEAAVDSPGMAGLVFAMMFFGARYRGGEEAAEAANAAQVMVELLQLLATPPVVIATIDSLDELD